MVQQRALHLTEMLAIDSSAWFPPLADESWGWGSLGRLGAPGVGVGLTRAEDFFLSGLLGAASDFRSVAVLACSRE